MYKLYFMPGACSMAVHVALNEINVPFEIENVKNSDGSRPKHFLEINSRGNVPVLTFDKFVLREGAAILIYLLDNHQNNLLPRSGLERAVVLEWLAFANSSLHPAYSRLFAMHRILADEAPKNKMYDATINLIQKHWDDIELSIANKKYLCSDQCSISDILITVIANWSFSFAKPIKFGNKTKQLLTNVTSRPSYNKALEVEGIKYIANK